MLFRDLFVCWWIYICVGIDVMCFGGVGWLVEYDILVILLENWDFLFVKLVVEYWI